MSLSAGLKMFAKSPPRTALDASPEVVGFGKLPKRDQIWVLPINGMPSDCWY